MLHVRLSYLIPLCLYSTCISLYSLVFPSLICIKVVICGDQLGRIFQFDVTDMIMHTRCLDKEAKPRISTSLLAAYQQHTVSNFRDGLDEKRLRQIETLITRPIGAKCISNNQKMTEVIGYRGVNITHIKRMRHWFAYQGMNLYCYYSCIN